MDSKNIIINNHITALREIIDNLGVAAARLTDDADENAAIISTLYVLVDALKAQTTITQNSLDSYK